MDPTMGGPCQGIRNLAPELDALGCANEIVCLDDPASSYLAEEKLTVHAIGKASGPWARHPGLVPWLGENLPRFDAVIIHGLWQYASYAVTKSMRQLRRDQTYTKLPRVYVMPHGMLDPWFQNEPSRRIKAYRNWVYWKLIEHRTISEATGVLFTCQKELELSRLPFCPYRPQQEINVGYGVAEPPARTDSMDQTFRDTCPQLGTQPFLLFLSRIHPKKGVDLLINAYARLAEQADAVKDFPALVIAGPTDSEYANNMQRNAASHQLLRNCQEPKEGPGIIFPGMLQGDAKWGAFYGCEAFVLPSHQENFGISVVEALACGKPVLISDQVNIFSDIEADGAAFISNDELPGVTNLLARWLSTQQRERIRLQDSAFKCYRKRYLPTAAAQKITKSIDQKWGHQ
ncbi:glycosyl transferase group 1 [Rhodopirellula sallentina SM41]|uniref:Glycosyl transferase group 1 n=2 Tax=Rhodopirellula TaxID=265488 RepID=M5UAU1_9BACT|nr:glycosyl transferase group 1 [Rhodopirellula sallentina SM41]